MSTVRDLPRLNLKKVYVATPRTRALVDKAQYCENARVLEKEQITLNTFIKSCSFLVRDILENCKFEREYEAETDTDCFSDNNSQNSSLKSGLDLQSIGFINDTDIYEELDYKSKLEKITQLTDDTDNIMESESEDVAVSVQTEEVADVQPEQAADAQPTEVTVVQDPMSIERATTLVQMIEENENPAVNLLNQDGDPILCVACFTSETQNIFSPCGHTTLCRHCTTKILFQFISGATPEFKCNVCWSPFEELQQLLFID
ncbi:GSCOCG00011755001-RA-CDS [Cotesia congregata]|nr:GSCOCG00011755001-RA-CDS [Cotesia congregata]